MSGNVYEHPNPKRSFAYIHQVALATETFTEVLQATSDEHVLSGKTETTKMKKN